MDVNRVRKINSGSGKGERIRIVKWSGSKDFDRYRKGKVEVACCAGNQKKTGSREFERDPTLHWNFLKDRQARGGEKR